MTPEDFTRLCQSLDLSYKDAARVLGVAAPTVWRWQAGERPIPDMAIRFLRLMRKAKLSPEAIEKIVSR